MFRERPFNAKTLGKRIGDHAGHLIADLFGGSPELDNLVSQLSRVNQSEYRKIEIQWAQGVVVVTAEGKVVTAWGKSMFDSEMKKIIDRLYGE